MYVYCISFIHSYTIHPILTKLAISIENIYPWEKDRPGDCKKAPDNCVFTLPGKFENVPGKCKKAPGNCKKVPDAF